MTLNITIPVLNEEEQLAASVSRVLSMLDGLEGMSAEVVVADNGSTDRTARIAEGLAGRDGRVRVVRLEHRGRGGALKRAWMDSQAAVLSYMDVDLSTDLEAFPRLIRPILEGTHEMVTGSRLLRGSCVKRGIRRAVMSHVYSRLVRGVLRVPCLDFQCGFKAISRRAAEFLLPQVMDTGWFFDTELIVRADEAGCSVLEIPVKWVDDPDSRVQVMRTVVADLRGVARLWWERGKRRGGDPMAVHRARISAMRLP